MGVPTFNPNTKTLKNDRKNIISAGKYAQKQLDSINTKLTAMGGTFDTKKSAYYQQAYGAARDTYMNRGRQAMKSATAEASAQTGGYGNSFATTAGNQAFQEQLNNLSAQIPSLYAAAENTYNNQKSDLRNQYNSWLTERGQKMDTYSNLASFDQQNAITQYDSNYNKYKTAQDIKLAHSK